MTPTRDYLKQLLVPAQCSLSAPFLRTIAIYLQDALRETPDATEAMCEEAIQVMLLANRAKNCEDAAVCWKRLRDAGWKFSKGEAG